MEDGTAVDVREPKLFPRAFTGALPQRRGEASSASSCFSAARVESCIAAEVASGCDSFLPEYHERERMH